MSTKATPESLSNLSDLTIETSTVFSDLFTVILALGIPESI